MNIIVFDNDNNFHQWRDRREFTKDFILTQPFFSDSTTVNKEHLAQHIAGVKEKGHMGYKYGDIWNKDSYDFSQINFKADDEGMILIDYVNHELYSLSAFMAPHEFHSIMLDAWFSSNFQSAQSDNFLSNVHYLLKSEKFVFEEKIEDNLIERIEAFLATGEKIPKKSKNLWNRDKLILNPHKTSWRMGWSSNRANTDITYEIVYALARKNISLSESQTQSWFEWLKPWANLDSNRALNNDFFLEPYLRVEKERLEAQVKLNNNNNSSASLVKI